MAHNSSTQTVVTRFAPSPTGFMHIGSVRTALYAYLFAKKHGGTFILRIEDTDKGREVSGSIEHIKESLRWLGLTWDYGPDAPGPFGPCIQSERLAIYRAYAERLIAAGHAYPDPYTAEEVEAFRAEAIANGKPFLFRDHRPTEVGAWDGTQPLRFRAPFIKRYTWYDIVRGELSAGEEMIDDFILIKADGYPTYNFAHIVDDIEMNVTHVMRGEEFISSTPKFLSVYDALQIAYPHFVTLPPILGPDGKKKLSKRDNAKDLLEYRTDGYLPEALCNFLALIGWNPGTNVELFPGDSLKEAFTLEKIQRSGGAFDETKLQWMNKAYLVEKDLEFKIAYVAAALPAHTKALPQFSTERLTKLTPVIMERIHTQTEITAAAEAGEYDFAFATPDYDPTLLQWKQDASVSDAAPRLRQALATLETADFSNPETIKTALWDYAETVGKGQLLWPLRVALSGRERSPDPFTIAYILGQTETCLRISHACDKIEG